MISWKIFLNKCVCVVVSVLIVNLYWLASHSRLVETGNYCSSRDGVSGTGHYWSSPQLISPQDIWLMLQRGWKLQFVKVCFTVCYTQWWKVRCSWLSTLTQIVNYPTSALLLFQIWLFQAFHTAALCKEYRVQELSLYTVIFGIVRCYYCPVDLSVSSLLSELLWFVGVLLNQWIRLKNL